MPCLLQMQHQVYVFGCSQKLNVKSLQKITKIYNFSGVLKINEEFINDLKFIYFVMQMFRDL